MLPKAAPKRIMPVFCIKVNFSGRKFATKLLCVKTFSGKVVRHSLAYLTVLKRLVADVLLYLNLGQSDPPLKKQQLPIDICS